VPGELPTGTVTFLFTDVEGSTQLLDELGEEAYAAALGHHRDVIRGALAAHDGAEVDTQGDAFFCAFSSARSAVACAEAIQSSLSSGPIRVRIGLHTGEALLVGGHYVGMDVHRAARIGASGHGGQVVVSPTTAALVEPGAFPLTDLGEHRLKDLSAPVTLYQLRGESFPPLKTLFRTNLPIPGTTFVGREDELRELVEQASRSDVRLLTLAGPGGSGKTRIALQLAAELGDRFPDGTRWVPLASLRDEAHVASAVAQALDVQEDPETSLESAIAAALTHARSLLLLDNCEHVLDAVALVVSPVVEACPDTLVLATSREPLAVAAEHVYAVDPLVSADAVTLFRARARAAGAPADAADGDSAIEELCARLDNLPLAVELAAARAAALPPKALLERLSRLDVLKGPRDAEERQRTLRATIEWSHELLQPGEQQLFRRMSVFAGGAGLELVEDVCEADLEEVLSLVSKSLVRVTADAGAVPRYWMLETIREFAAEKLDASGEQETRRTRHVESFVALARESRDAVASGAAGAFAVLEQNRENLRVAFARAHERARAAGEDATGAFGSAVVELAAALAPLHRHHGRYAEAADVLRLVLALGPDPVEAALFMSQLGLVLRHQGRWDDSLASHLAAETALGAPSPDAGSSWWHAWLDTELELAHYYYYVGEETKLAEVIERLRPHVDERGTPQQAVGFLHTTAQAAYRRERYALSPETEALVRDIHRRSLALGATDADFTLGFCLLWRGAFDEATTHLRRGRETARAAGDALVETRCLVYDAMARRRRGDVEGVRRLLGELDSLDELHGYSGLLAANHAWLALRDGDLDAVTRYAGGALADWERVSGSAGPTIFQWTARFPLLAVALERGDLDAALDEAALVVDRSQQPLPLKLQEAVEEALRDRDPGKLRGALELARAGGYV
jgi:predicted ATPase/class 3 adenylate cyclase